VELHQHQRRLDVHVQVTLGPPPVTPSRPFLLSRRPPGPVFVCVCSMDKGDAAQPIVKIRGNRAYICKWQVEEQLAHWQVRVIPLDAVVEPCII